MNTHTTGKPPKPPRITIKAESYSNLPNKFRRQHGKFDITNPGMGQAVTAMVKHMFTYDLLNDMGMLDDSQVGCAMYFTVCRDAAHRRPRTIFDGLEEQFAQGLPDKPSDRVDVYYRLVRLMPKKQFSYVVMACDEVGEGENIHALRSALFKLAPDIENAFKMLEQYLDEIRACNS